MSRVFWTRTVAACAMMGAMSHGAAAGTVVVTSVSTAYGDNSGIVNVNVPGAPTQPWTTPIILDTTKGTLVVFCDDLFHNIYVPSSDTFHTGLVTTDSNGHSLTTAQSATMGNIAAIGLADYRGGDMAGAIAAQAAIWAVEYGKGNVSIDTSYGGYSSTEDAEIAADFSAFEKLSYKGGKYAEGLIGEDGVQSQITGVPELSTWVLMLAGFAGLGFAGYRRSNSGAAPATVEA